MLILNIARNLLKADFRLKFGSFTVAMAEALDKQVQNEENKVNRPSYKPRYNGRMKKRQWEQNDRNDRNEEEIEAKRANFDPADRIKRKKCIILLGYSGVNYFGMQRNPGMKTVEEDLFTAMLKTKWISEEGFNQAQMISFQRAARTDKGVSAARQCCSLKLPENVDLDVLNSELPEQIKVFRVQRVTKGFNSKDQCDARTYTYTLPTISFSDHNSSSELDVNTYRVSQERLELLNKILKNFEGTKNFHNFTSRKEFLDPSSKRYIMTFECGAPFLSSSNTEFATIKVKGQSFMLHQIRKMIGLSLAILRGHTTEETLQRAFSKERLDIPMAPGLGLVLDQVHYDRYNKRYGEDGVHEPLTWEKEDAEIQTFSEKYIYSTIIEAEIKDKPMLAWLETLSLHSYNVRTNDDKNVNDDNSENGE